MLPFSAVSHADADPRRHGLGCGPPPGRDRGRAAATRSPAWRAVRAELPRGVAFVRADRTEAGCVRAGRSTSSGTWSSTCPGSPARSAARWRRLRERTRHFVFISSGNVYADHRARPARTRAVRCCPALAAAGDGEHGQLRRGRRSPASSTCWAAFGPDACLIARVGSDRRARRPVRPLGVLAAPVRPAGGRRPTRCWSRTPPPQPTQVIDVRDLAAWLVEAGAARVGWRVQCHGRDRGPGGSPGTGP